MPSREELARFYDELNVTYRTALGRPPREAAGTAAERVEGIARYLAYRMEGCPQADSEARALRDVIGPSAPELCPGPAPNHELPPADQTYAFARQLDRALGEHSQPIGPSTRSYPPRPHQRAIAHAREEVRRKDDPLLLRPPHGVLATSEGPDEDI